MTHCQVKKSTIQIKHFKGIGILLGENMDWHILQILVLSYFNALQDKILKLLLPKYLKLWLLGEKYLNYASSLPHLLNYQMVPLFSIPPTWISKIVGHSLMHNFDSPITFGEKVDTMIELINILPRKCRAYLKLQMERNTESRGEDFLRVAQKFSPHFQGATFSLCNNVCI